MLILLEPVAMAVSLCATYSQLEQTAVDSLKKNLKSEPTEEQIEQVLKQVLLQEINDELKSMKNQNPEFSIPQDQIASLNVESSKQLYTKYEALFNLNLDKAKNSEQKTNDAMNVLEGKGVVEAVIKNKELFDTKLQDFNERLKEYDALDSRKRRGETLNNEENELLEKNKLLADERVGFVAKYPQFHSLASARDTSSSTYKHLQGHFDGTELGSVFTNNEGDAFTDPQQVIDLSEDILAEVYKTGNLPERDGWTLRLVSGNPPGGRIVIEAVSDNALGEDALVEITNENKDKVFRGKRTTGGRDNDVNLVVGTKKKANKMLIIGGPYGPTGQFGLFTVFPGEYAPSFSPINDPIVGMTGTDFWNTHGFIAETNELITNLDVNDDIKNFLIENKGTPAVVSKVRELLDEEVLTEEQAALLLPKTEGGAPVLDKIENTEEDIISVRFAAEEIPLSGEQAVPQLIGLLSDHPSIETIAAVI